MSNQPRFIRPGLALAVTLGLATSAAAQQTSSSIRGSITGPQGNADTTSTITVIHVPSGTVRQTSVGSNGQFSVSGLRVGGPYRIEVDSDQFQDTFLDDVYLSLGEPYSANLTLSAPQDIENIVVTASPISSISLNERGPSANFGLEQLQSAPAINRNISDVVRLDPRIYVDESRGDQNGIQCGGKNPRFNSLTLDGVRMNDSFGLNDNGYPTERMPFSYDAIEQVAVELAPFDVIYGGFTACNINAVTKSGTNEFRGSAFYDYTSDSMRGDSLEGDKIALGDYSEKRYGFSIGGPLIKDKLFFFAAYEKLEGANLFERGPIGSGAVNIVDVSQQELDEIVSIAKDLYLYDPGPIPSSLDNEDEKLLVKLDWNINDQHRFSFTYNYNDGNNFTESDDENYEFEFENHLYERGAKLNSYSGALYSDWSDNFSTEIRLGYLDLDNRQIPVGGTDFGEIRVETPNVDVYLGADDSRHANDLNYDILNFSFRGLYYFDNGHNVTFGFETETLDVFNMFVQHAETEIRFRSIDDFRAGFPSAIYYNNAPSNVPQDAAAEWSYTLNSLYMQDEFDLLYGDLTVVMGIRFDWYSSSDKPIENTAFTQEYGFSNTNTLDGEGLFQPRLGLTYRLSDDTTLRGGLGLYTGGNPNVWLSNNFSANNVLQFGQRGRNFGYTDGSRSLFDGDIIWQAVEEGRPAGPGYGIPSELYEAVAGGSGDNFEINYLDPGFDLPSEWKLSLGVNHTFDNDYVVSADLLVTHAMDSAIVLHGDLERVGTTEDGYPIYDSVREPSFVLTNSKEDSTSYTLSASMYKSYDFGLDYILGYAFTESEDVQPMTSAVAFSNYTNRAFFDPQEQVSSTSNYNIRHRFTAMLNYEMFLFGDYKTQLSVYGSLNEGQPYSVTYDGTVDPYDFTPYLDFLPIVLRPGEERNSNEGPWWGKVDIKLTQEFPGLAEGHRASAFLIVDNFTNLLNDDWGILDEVDFPNTVEEGSEPFSRVGDASLYEIRIGVRYEF
ncbi:cell envelope biogenesis protein OmpA [Alteromonas aestuariivivens]|uniref:Cell envelope biogenesis protein OmpA n=1 Tax=Alteromonas aestuariivivens TaxID=1938339 RepID=A0A3D8M355_9ALTE|nr:TonB-dependent receptor [Alteromonas aestuariivivens]RDV24058.1 cell envelope biogenesis protein OmpA [Alteromonas aestuariivivens]